MKRYLLMLILSCAACGGMSLEPAARLRPLTPPTTSTGLASPPLIITALNVGQGDAVHVQFPSGDTMLIDGGPPVTGAPLIRSWLGAQQLPLPHYTLTTHYDLDHVGGLTELMLGPDANANTDDDYRPLQCLDRGARPQRRHWLTEQYLALRADCHQIATAGQAWNFGEATVSIMTVNGAHDTQTPAGSDENAHSIVVLIEHGDFRYLHMADLPGGGGRPPYQTIDLESSLATTLPDVDVMLAGHHGSKTSSNATLLKRTAPEHAIISAGLDNDYGHPHREVLERFAAQNVQVWRTSGGHVQVRSDGAEYTIEYSND